MDLIINNWEAIFAAIAVIGGLFGAGFLKVKKYIDFAKEVGDIYVRYNEFSKDGVFTDAEKLNFGGEVIEAIEAGKVAFK